MAIKNEKPRDTGNFGHTKTQDEDNKKQKTKNKNKNKMKNKKQKQKQKKPPKSKLKKKKKQDKKIGAAVIKYINMFIRPKGLQVMGKNE